MHFVFAFAVLALVACDQSRCIDDPPLLAIDETVRQSAIGTLTPNGEALELFQTEHASGVERRYWLALVPGTSEQWGHHKAPPLGVMVSDEFATRLDRAADLLTRGEIAFIVVSGGSVDAERPDYNEAERGRAYLIERGVAAQRVFIDPYAEHSTTNVRNADKLAVQLGLDRILIITTMPEGATLAPSDVATQGYYFLYHQVTSFDARAQGDVGYSLGSFSRVFFGDTQAIEHCGFDRAQLAADDYGP